MPVLKSTKPASGAAAADDGGGGASGSSNLRTEEESKAKDQASSGRSDDSEEEDDEEEDEDSDSDLDVEEIERSAKRRRECLAAMSYLERKFTLWKEDVFNARLKKIDERLAAVRSGNSQEYVDRVQELRDEQYRKDMVAYRLYERRIRSAKLGHEARRLQCKQTLDNEKWHLRERVRDELARKLRHLDEEYNGARIMCTVMAEKLGREKRELLLPELDGGGDCPFDLAAVKEENVDVKGGWELAVAAGTGTGSGAGAGTRASRRTLAGGGRGRRRKPVAVTGPYVVYNLDEETIMEDWAFFKKLAETPRDNYDHLT